MKGKSMSFIKCKNNEEKIAAIKKYCQEKIEENTFQINWYKSEQVSSLDYDVEIRELQNRNCDFQKIIEILDADEHTLVLL